MAIYPDDIDENILAALGQIFQLELQTNVSDALSLRTLRQAPLQDDPTLTAPFLVYSNALDGKEQCIRLITKSEEAEYGMAEIGGPIRFLYCYSCSFGTPQETTRDRARIDSSTLMTRIMHTLIHHQDLSGILASGQQMTSDNGVLRIEGQNNRLITSAGYDIFGGENTFFGKGSIYWHYPVSWFP